VSPDGTGGAEPSETKTNESSTGESGPFSSEPPTEERTDSDGSADRTVKGPVETPERESYFRSETEPLDNDPGETDGDRANPDGELEDHDDPDTDDTNHDDSDTDDTDREEPEVTPATSVDFGTGGDDSADEIREHGSSSDSGAGATD